MHGPSLRTRIADLDPRARGPGSESLRPTQGPSRCRRRRVSPARAGRASVAGDRAQPVARERPIRGPAARAQADVPPGTHGRASRGRPHATARAADPGRGHLRRRLPIASAHRRASARAQRGAGHVLRLRRLLRPSARLLVAASDARHRGRDGRARSAARAGARAVRRRGPTGATCVSSAPTSSGCRRRPRGAQRLAARHRRPRPARRRARLPLRSPTSPPPASMSAFTPADTRTSRCCRRATSRPRFRMAAKRSKPRPGIGSRSSRTPAGRHPRR